eukprot:GHVR01186039.1.p1 GENE.GHVR01186039.1~~GHVR01186039.1.p1  ORF type:complete len:122 (-),score=19.09 GHVR01186039.1:73-438(-)
MQAYKARQRASFLPPAYNCSRDYITSVGSVAGNTRAKRAREHAISIEGIEAEGRRAEHSREYTTAVGSGAQQNDATVVPPTQDWSDAESVSVCQEVAIPCHYFNSHTQFPGMQNAFTYHGM